MISLLLGILIATAAASGVSPSNTTRLPFITDDYAHARAEATRRHVPLFVEVWAPW